MNLRETIRRPRVRKSLAVFAALLGLWTVVGFLVLPRILRPVLERKLAASLHRPVSVRRLSLNPFALSATLEGLAVGEKGGTGSFLSLERAYVNLEAVSLFRLAPVIREITLTKPSIHIARNESGAYSFQDLLDEAAKPKPKGSDEPARFSLNNIRIEGGSLDFDDRLKRVRHTVRNVRIGIPFLSNIPSQVEITTQPVFEALVNGAPFALHGRTKPFSATHETAVDLDLSDLDLPYYLAYLPGGASQKLTAGRLDLKLALRFFQPPAGPSTLLLSGTSSVRKLAVEAGRRPWLAWERLDAVVDSFDVFGRKLRIRSVLATAPELWIRRDRAAVRNPPAAPAATPAGKPPERPMPIEIAECRIERGTIHYDDLALDMPFHGTLGDVAISSKGFSNAPGQKATLEISAKTDAGETLKSSGTISADPFVLEGAMEIGGLPFKRYRPFYDRLVRFEVDDGVLDLGTKYRFSGTDTVLSELTARLRAPRLRKREEKTPFFQAPSVELGSSSFDLAKRSLALGALSSGGGLLAVARDKNGDADLTKLLNPSPSPSPSPATADSPPEPPSAPWTIALRKLALAGYTIRIDDHATPRPARYALTKTDVTLEDFSTAPGKKANLSVRFGIDGKGTASAAGPVGIHPTYAELKADVKGLDLVPLEAYILSSFHLSLARGTLTANGTLALREAPGDKTSIGFTGKALVADLLAVDPDTKLDVFRWDALSFEGTKAGYNPTFLQVARFAIAGIACDVVIEPDGTMNLSKIVGQTPAAPADGKDGSESAAAAATAAAPPSPPPGTDDHVPIRIDTLVVENGRIGLADHFVKPGYSATLTGLSGQMTGLSTDAGTVAQLELRGTLGNRSPLEISGRVNPLAATAFADVKGSFRDIDLPSFTPYSGKYAGYAIARGTLTMEVQYKLENRKLSAQNRFLVDQFELGDKVESPDATKLPVRLAVSLLRDKDGLIDLDLPIEGSLDDPKFRLGKVIWQVLGNLIGKAATAPFALLGKLLGGKGEELSSIDFADGSAELDEAAKKKLDTLAKALNGRPALKLDVAGRSSGDPDLEGLRKIATERKVKARNVHGTPDDLRQLALARANAVKDDLVGRGGVDPSRVLVLDPADQPATPAEKARASRVDFVLR